MAQILINFSIITTALLFRTVLGRVLNQLQWASLVTLTCGIITISPRAADPATDVHSGASFSSLTLGYLLVLTQWYASLSSHLTRA